MRPSCPAITRRKQTSSYRSAPATEDLCFLAKTAVPKGLGGLLQAALRGAGVCTPVSRALHPSGRHFQPSTRILRRPEGHFPLRDSAHTLLAFARRRSATADRTTIFHRRITLSSALSQVWRSDGCRRKTDCRPDPTPFSPTPGYGCCMKPLFTNSQTCLFSPRYALPALCGCYGILVRPCPTLPFPEASTAANFQAPIFPASASEHHHGVPQLSTVHRLNTHSTASAATASGFLLTA
jgi:hypothetical protein